MASKTSRSNNNIYALVNDLRLELKGDIKGVGDQVAELATTVNENEVKQAVSSTKIGMLITGITLVVSAITTVLINSILGRHVP